MSSNSVKVMGKVSHALVISKSVDKRSWFLEAVSIMRSAHREWMSNGLREVLRDSYGFGELPPNLQSGEVILRAAQMLLADEQLVMKYMTSDKKSDYLDFLLSHALNSAAAADDSAQKINAECGELYLVVCRWREAADRLDWMTSALHADVFAIKSPIYA